MKKPSLSYTNQISYIFPWGILDIKKLATYTVDCCIRRTSCQNKMCSYSYQPAKYSYILQLSQLATYSHNRCINNQLTITGAACMYRWHQFQLPITLHICMCYMMYQANYMLQLAISSTNKNSQLAIQLAKQLSCMLFTGD